MGIMKGEKNAKLVITAGEWENREKEKKIIEREDVISSIEERISILLDIMNSTKNLLTDDGLPDPRHSRAYAEWRILRATSITLHEMNFEDTFK